MCFAELEYFPVVKFHTQKCVFGKRKKVLRLRLRKMYARSLAQTLHRCRSAVGPVLRGGPAVALPTLSRAAHTDLSVPDFSGYRSSHTENPNELSSRGELGKRAAAYMVLGGVFLFEAHLNAHTIDIYAHTHCRWAGSRDGAN